jgi:hypothetical protein
MSFHIHEALFCFSISCWTGLRLAMAGLADVDGSRKALGKRREMVGTGLNDETGAFQRIFGHDPVSRIDE